MSYVSALKLKFKAVEIENYSPWKKIISREHFLELSTALLYKMPSAYKESELIIPYTESEKKEMAALDCVVELEKIKNSLDFAKHPSPGKTSIELKEAFEKKFSENLLANLRDKPAKVGVPTQYLAPGVINPDFTKFYDNVESLLREFLYHFLKKMESSTDQESEKFLMLSELFYVFKRCGGQWEGGLGELCISQSIGHADAEMALRAHYSCRRNDLFKMQISEWIDGFHRQDSRGGHLGNEVHLRNYFLKQHGAALGIPRASQTTEGTLFISRYPLDKIKDAIFKKFSSESVIFL